MGEPGEDMRAGEARFDPRLALIVYVRVLSTVFLVSGLQNWGRILGSSAPEGNFLDLPAPVIVATLFFAVAELVAAVGLWLLASWGTVVWMVSALTECVLHGAFPALFGQDWTLIAFHIASVAVYGALIFLYERSRDHGRESTKG